MGQMNEHGASGLEPELRISPRSMIAILFALAEAVKYMVASLPNWSQIWGLLVLFQALLLVAWLVDEWKPCVGRWLTIMALVTVIQLSDDLLGVTGFLVMMPIAVALAAALIGLSGAAATAAAGTALLFRADHDTQGLNTGDTVIGLIGLWGMLGVMYAAYRPLREAARWSFQQSQRAQRRLGEARARQAEFRQALDDLWHANRQLSLMNEKVAGLRLLAEEAQKAKAAFVAKVSHEFRTPLNMIIGLTDLLIETPEIYGERLPQKLLEHLEIVHRNCDHLSGMIDDVLDLSQIGAGRMGLHRDWADLREIIGTALTVVRPLAEKKNLRLEMVIPENLPRVYCDRTRILQVVVNLLSNAARFTEEGGITTHVAEDDNDVIVSVTDTGPGMASEETQSIFEPFSQGRGGRRRKGGSGLGLSISKEFVELHGGRMWLESEMGAGSTFAFRLPISGPMEHAAPPGRWIAEGWVERKPRTRGAPVRLDQRVIICDETGELHALFTRRYDEIEYVDTRDLQQTVHELRQCPAQAVLLNAASPDALWPLVHRAMEEIRETPIIGSCVPPKAERALAAGATGYLTKPVKRAKLLAAIERIGRPVKRVLVVDDEADAVTLLDLSLRAYDSRLEIATASTGREALEAIRKWKPDLVLLDIVMPQMDGWQVLALKNQEARIADIPVIVVSAQDPRDQPYVSKVVLCTMGDGLSVSKLLRCSRQLSALLLQPE